MVGLNTRDVIDGVCLEPRIGAHYNNPSFGYGGYCPPKDTKQLLANYKDVPQNLIEAIVDANRTRKDFVDDEVLQMVWGKAYEARRSRSSACAADHEVEQRQLPHELDSGRHEARQGQGRARGGLRPTLDAPEFFGSEVTHDLTKFKAECDVIVVNRWSDDLSDVVDKVYTRDLFKGASAEGGLCLGLCWIESRGVSAGAGAPLFRFWRGWIFGSSQATRRAVQAIRFLR